MSQQPSFLISIIVPSFQHNSVVGRAVDSALKQTYPNKEIIVVDDGSDPPVVVPQGVTLIRHEVNRGLSAALNTGIRASHGERFVILAADDQLSPYHLEKTSKFNTDVVSVDMLVNGQRIVTKPGTLEELKAGNCHSYAALVKRSMYDKVGGFKKLDPSWEDFEYWVSCAEAGATWSHVHDGLHFYNRSNTGRDAQAQGKDRLLWGKLQGYHQDLYGKGKGFVTFIVPLYKQEKFVATAVSSALNQVYPHTNVVVVDDGSPGDVPGALAELGDTNGRVTVLRQKNGGLSAARNSGAKYALDYLNSQYLAMLDADDEVDPNFVEDTMSVMGMDERVFVYTDLKFIGDAWHSYALEEYDCERLTKKHIHACTFLMQADMYREIRESRGYGYDEAMRSGWEDWEFSLACVENNWCGKRLPKELFHYRFHKNGSMRTAAQKKQDKLSKYIYGKHPWMLDERQKEMACKTCGGGGRFTSARVAGKAGGRGMVFVPGFGDMAADEQLLVRYTGPTTSTITKVGIGGTIYKYSANPEKIKTGQGPVFTIFAKDAHMFQGPYDMKRATPEAVTANATEAQVQAPPVTQQTVLPGNIKIIEIFPEPKAPENVVKSFTQETFLVETPKEEEVAKTGGDDFTVLEGVSKQKHNKLVEAGFYNFRDIARADVRELANVLNTSKVRAQIIIDQAAERA